jgi:hypothetical protein
LQFGFCFIKTTKEQKELRADAPAVSGEIADRLIVCIKHRPCSVLGELKKKKLNSMI